jgi:hypothetical protein
VTARHLGRHQCNKLFRWRGPRHGTRLFTTDVEDDNELKDIADKARRSDQPRVLPAYVELLCASAQVRQWLAPFIKSAAGQHGISGADLKRLPLPIITEPQQLAIVRHTQAALSWIDRLAREASFARKLIDPLDESVLAKGFRGELVPQDPNDEPASVLLERIRAERDAAPANPRSRKRRAISWTRGFIHCSQCNSPADSTRC